MSNIPQTPYAVITHTCQICHQTGSMFSLDIPIDDTDQHDTAYICGSCWDIIAAVAQRAVSHMLPAPPPIPSSSMLEH